MPRSYPPEFRRKVLDLVEAGRPIKQVAEMLPGISSSEDAELIAARRRIAELEQELAIHRRAAELLDAVVPPKGGSRPSR